MFESFNTYTRVTLGGCDKILGIDYFTINDLQSIEEDLGIGLYAWYLLPPQTGDKSAIKAFHKLFWSKKYEGKMTGLFGERFTGDLKYDLSDEVEKKIEEFSFSDSPEIQKFFRLAALNFSPVLYIGRSQNLNERLKEHINELRINLKNPESIDKDLLNRIVEEDTAEESTSFARRITAYLHGNLQKDSYRVTASLNNFIVKVIYVKGEDIDYTDIKKLETYFNRTFRPVIGRL